MGASSPYPYGGRGFPGYPGGSIPPVYPGKGVRVSGGGAPSGEPPA